MENREIKFRAWDKKKIKMIKHIRNIDFALGKIMSEYILDITEGQNSGNYFRGFEHIELMQYTGLKDENGKEIYEGDVCKSISGYLTEVIYDTSKASFSRVDVKDKKGGRYGISGKSCEVIGNIYENPELLK
jgi:uncharacterized phage protein (TIGR01671 family)